MTGDVRRPGRALDTAISGSRVLPPYRARSPGLFPGPPRIPEFQDLGENVSEQFSAAIASQKPVTSALALAQLYAQSVGNTYRTA